MTATIYKVELLVVDTEEMGEEQIRCEFENMRFINAEVKKIESRKVEWTDEHPLNKSETCEEAYRKLFE